MTKNDDDDEDDDKMLLMKNWDMTKLCIPLFSEMTNLLLQV